MTDKEKWLNLGDKAIINARIRKDHNHHLPSEEIILQLVWEVQSLRDRVTKLEKNEKNLCSYG